MTWLIILIIVLILFVVIPSIIFTYAGLKFVKMLKKNKNDLYTGPKMDLSFYENSPHKLAAKIGREYMDKNKSEVVKIKSHDGFNLSGFLYPSPNGNHKKLIIGFHGFKSAARMEFAPFIKFYHDMGFDMLAIDQRAHGLSEGKYCTMGTIERLDALSWINFAIEKYGKDVEILLHGVSMGAATVCCVSGENLPLQVKGIISDCAYSSTKDEISFQLKSMFKTPKFPIVNICEMYCKSLAKFDFKSYSPIVQVAKSKTPILFVHGEKDCIVPVKSATELYNACSSRKQLLIIKNANHAESIAVDPKTYHNAIKEFFNI